MFVYAECRWQVLGVEQGETETPKPTIVMIAGQKVGLAVGPDCRSGKCIELLSGGQCKAESKHEHGTNKRTQKFKRISD